MDIKVTGPDADPILSLKMTKHEFNCLITCVAAAVANSSKLSNDQCARVWGFQEAFKKLGER